MSLPREEECIFQKLFSCCFYILSSYLARQPPDKTTSRNHPGLFTVVCVNPAESERILHALMPHCSFSALNCFSLKW